MGTPGGGSHVIGTCLGPGKGRWRFPREPGVDKGRVEKVQWSEVQLGGRGGEAKQDTAQEGPEMIKVTRPYHSHQPSL